MEIVNNLVKLSHQLKSDERFAEAMAQAEAANPWFTTQFVAAAVSAIADDMLNKTALEKWLNSYTITHVDKTIGLIFAGNIPLVGFHDFLCCYVTGCRMKIKLSSKDDKLFIRLFELLTEIDGSLADRLEIVDRLHSFDAVIATGNDNTHRYFQYYFRNVPGILRKNRNSVAILTGNETPDELELLADDIFMYFGFGCRNVSKLYVPTGFDIKLLFPRFEKYAWLHNHAKYMNNYDYQRTVLLLNRTPHLANEFVMILEDPGISSRIATLHYEFWSSEQNLLSHLQENSDKIQCIVSSNPERYSFTSSVPFGQSQHPGLGDYADNTDTISFLLGLI